MSSALPKEQQTAYQRWEMASFDEVRPVLAPVPAAPPPIPQPSEESIAEFNAQLEVLRNEAWQQGYAEGADEGRAAGLIEGRALRSGRGAFAPATNFRSFR